MAAPSIQSRICPCHCYKGSTEGDSEGSPVSSLCWAQPPQKICRHQWEGIGILCTYFEWYLSNTAVSWFFASVSKASLLEHCCRQQRDPEKQCTPPFFLLCSRENVAKNKEGLAGVPCGAETKLWVWYLMFSKSPVRQHVPDHVCKKSIDTAIQSQQTTIFGGCSWTLLVQRPNLR